MKRKQRSKTKTDDNFLEDVDIMYDPSYGEEYLQSRTEEMDLSEDPTTYCVETQATPDILYPTMKSDDTQAAIKGQFQ